MCFSFTAVAQSLTLKQSCENVSYKLRWIKPCFFKTSNSVSEITLMIVSSLQAAAVSSVTMMSFIYSQMSALKPQWRSPSRKIIPSEHFTAVPCGGEKKKKLSNETILLLLHCNSHFLFSFLQFPVGEQRGSARRRLPHLPVGGEGADEALQGPRLFPSGVLEDGGRHGVIGGGDERQQGHSSFWAGGVWRQVRRRSRCWHPSCLASSVQSSQSPSEAADGCEGSQVLPPTPPIMLQVNTHSPSAQVTHTHISGQLVGSSFIVAITGTTTIFSQILPKRAIKTKRFAVLIQQKRSFFFFFICSYGLKLWNSLSAEIWKQA